MPELPRFVLLRHELDSGHGGTHWDLMLEQNSTLKTWALADRPESGKTISAKALPDHRLRYLAYEGPVSGDRGRVTREDTGTWSRSAEGDGLWEFEVFGTWFRGHCSLRHHAGGSWEFIYHDNSPSGTD